MQFSRLPKKPCRSRNCSKIPQETWKVKVQKHIQRFVFNRLKYVLSTSLFACHCAHCSFFFFFLIVLQPGRCDWHIYFFIFCQRRSKSGFSEVNICLLVKERCWLIKLIHRKMMFPYFQSSSQNGLNQANLKMECSNKKTTNILSISKPCRMYSKYSLHFARWSCIRKLSNDPVAWGFSRDVLHTLLEICPP